MPDAARTVTDETEEAVRQALRNPKRFAVDGMEVTAHDPGEVVAAAEFLEKRRAARNPWAAVRRAVAAPPGGAE